MKQTIMNNYNVTIKQTTVVDYTVTAATAEEAEMLALGCATAGKTTISVTKKSSEVEPWRVDYSAEIKSNFPVPRVESMRVPVDGGQDLEIEYDTRYSPPHSRDLGYNSRGPSRMDH